MWLGNDSHFLLAFIIFHSIAAGAVGTGSASRCAIASAPAPVTQNYAAPALEHYMHCEKKTQNKKLHCGFS
jgi:hypothetical protein